MIYIWFNPKSSDYQLGSLNEFKALKKKYADETELTLLYKFVKNKNRLANKILKQLNSVVEEDDNHEDENTFYRVY